MNLVSIIIPCFNSERYIRETLNSALSQSHKSIEVICVDDGSVDRTNTIIEEYQQRYNNLFLIRSRGKGASVARNTGLAFCKGDFVQYLDSDDVLLRDKIERQLLLMELEGGDMVISDYELYDESLNHLLIKHSFEKVVANPLEVAIKQVISTNAPLYSKRILLEVRGHNESLRSCQDWDLNLRLVLNNVKILYLPGTVSRNRKVSGSVSSDWIQVSKQFCELVSIYKNAIKSHKYFSTNVAKYISATLYNTAVYSDSSENKKYIQEIKYWTKSDVGFLSSQVKKLIAKLIGFRGLVNIEKMRANVSKGNRHNFPIMA